MFSTKLEVDKHVENCLKKINSENERNLRCLAFAKLYFKVGDYEQARRFVSAYLCTKPFSAEAQLLLGKILEKQGKNNAALDAYRASLEIDPKQNNLILKVCELLASDDVSFDLSGARYFCEKAQSIDPSNPYIYSLKEKLIMVEGKDPDDISQLLQKELEARPNDVDLRIRLLRHLSQNNHIKEAFKHVYDVDQANLSVLSKSLKWYDVVAEILVKYQKENYLNLNWEFWMLLISVLDKVAQLGLDENSSTKTQNEYILNVFNFDQTLKIASENIQNCPEKQLVTEFLNHYRGQLCFHLVTLLFKQAKKDLIKFKEANQICLPLLFICYHHQPLDLQSMWINHTTERNRQLSKKWNCEALFRCSQAGHMLLAFAKDRKSTIIEKATQSSSGMWREQFLKRVFVTREQQSKINSSYFATCADLIDLTIRLPEMDDLIKYDETSQLVNPDSLHHYIWLGMNQDLPKFNCRVFEGLSYSTKCLNNCSAESLNVLDVQAFLYCSILCSQQLEEQRNNIYYPSDKTILPAAITSQLGTENQSNWLISAYKMFKNDHSRNFSEVRLALIRGIETVRCVGNHGLDVKLLVQLAKIFSERGKCLDKQSEVEFNDSRADLYWRTALPLLEKLKNNQAISYPANRLFEYKSKEMSVSEIQSYIDDGKLFTGVQYMKKKDNEKALQLFDNLRDPYASYYQAQIYKQQAEQQTNKTKESVTSEMRSQNIILLSKARDYLYLTFDRLRDPAADRKHPLNLQLGTEIDKIERMLSRIDPDARNECDALSDENMSSLCSTNEHNYTSFLNGNLTPRNDVLNATPRLEATRFEMSRREAKPSPERLEAQMRQLMASKDNSISQIQEQNKFILESHKALIEAVNNISLHTIEEIKSLKTSINELKHSISDLQNVTDSVAKMKKEIAELKKDKPRQQPTQLSEEDFFGLDEDYGTDYGNLLNANLPQSLYPNLPKVAGNSLQYGAAAAAAAAAAANLYPGVHYPMLPYAGLGLPQGLGYEGQDFRNLQFYPPYTQTSPLAQGLQPGLVQPVMPGPSLLQQNLTQPGIGASPLLPTSNFPSLTVAATPSIQSSLQNTLHTSLQQHQLHSQQQLNLQQQMYSQQSAQQQPLPSQQQTPNVPLNKVPPVNVVITSSDPLPSSTFTTTQPILSVTIPPQHLKGNNQKPHNYQIHLPTTTTISTPTIMSQTAPTVAMQNILTNVAPPVFSAVDKTPPKSTSLGFAIEKSLNESFGDAAVKESDAKDKNLNANRSDANRSNVSTSSLEEYDPCPDFKPIVPLPDEVPVNTGEEDETVLFENRAKLFRYDNGAKEWKERGVGTLKLLRNRDGKVRILMRRDQVHKICANHFIGADMSVTPMANNDKAYVWAANDFADQTVVLEKLCARFKTAEEARKFYVAVEDAKKNLTPTPQKEKSKDDKDKVKDDVKIKETTPAKSEAPNLAAATSLLGGFVFKTPPTFKPKDIQVEQPQTDAAKSSPFASFSFTKTPTTMATPVITPALGFKSFEQTKPEPTKLTFDIKPVETKPIETKANESKPSEVIKAPEPEKEADENVDDFEPKVDFKPVVPLPELVEVKTGEENAEVLFESKAKLLRFDATSREWKERGIGIFKVLKFDTTVRFLMRREQVHKVCCNHQLLKNMPVSFMPKNAKALSWCAQDFSDGQFSTEMFALRFKTEEQAKSCHDVVARAQGDLSDDGTIKTAGSALKTTESTPKAFDGAPKTSDDGTLKTSDGDGDRKAEKKVKGDDAAKTLAKANWDKHKPKLGSWTCKVCYVVNDGKTSHCPACDTPKNDAAKKEESGPQFSFGIKQDEKVKETTDGTVKPKEATDNSKQTAVEPKKSTEKVKDSTSTTSTGWGNAFKPPADSWECQMCLVRNSKENLYCLSCENPKDDTVPKKETKKGVNLETPGFSFTFGIPPKATETAASTQPPPTTTTNIFSSPAFTQPSTQNVTFGTPKGSSTFSFGSSTPTLAPENKQFTFALKPSSKPEEDEEKFVFGSPSKHNFEFTPRSPRRQSGGHGDEESETSYVEEEEDNIYFKPVIPLPEKVDVKTGEEGEDVVYCHRAKLFRFTDGEWKERGLGDVKVLKRRDDGKLRVVMRREQVLKICLNHALTPDIKYTVKDDKTWLFTAPDFSEGEIQHRQFCLRFKTAEVAIEFKAAIDGALGGEDAPKGDERVDDSEVEVVYETKVTPEEQQEAIRLGLPPKFMAYRQLDDCACDECKKDDVTLKDILKDKESSVSDNSFSTPPTTVSASKSESVYHSARDHESDPNLSADSSTASDTLRTLLIKPSRFQSSQSESVFSSPSLIGASDQRSTTTLDSKSSFTFNADPSASSGLFAASKPIFGSSSIFSSTTQPGAVFASASTGSIFNTPSLGGSIWNAKPASDGGIISSSTTSGNIFGGGSVFGNKTAASSNIFQPQQQRADSTTGSASSTTSSGIFQSNSGIFSGGSGSIFGNPPVKDDKTVTAGGEVSEATKPTIFGQSKGFGSTPIFGRSLHGGGNAQATLSFGSVAAAATSQDEPVLKTDSILSFSSLARKSGDAPAFGKQPTDDDDKNPFAFLGAGKPVFASSATNTQKKDGKKKEEDEEENEHETSGATGDDCYDPHYEPIIPLPAEVAVSTGEEDEEIKFNDRAKLFRYDTTTKEWKERGVGQLKILYHPQNHTYRFILRREQVHKVVLNQLITAELDLQPLSLSDKAWCWVGHNYSDDGHNVEKLAVRFKSPEMASKFFDSVQSAIAEVKVFQSNKTVADASRSDDYVEEVSVIPTTVYGGDNNEEPQSESANEDEYDDDEEEEEDYDEDEERSLMFRSDCTLYEAKPPTGEWQLVGNGEIVVCYDPEIFGSRIHFNDNHAELSNTVIGTNTVMNLQGNTCVWRAVEWANQVIDWRTLQAVFKDQETAESFHLAYLESVDYAEQSDIIDDLPRC